MTPTADADARPTASQLAYLKSLATRTGQSFQWPQTRAQASRQIRRLKSLPAADDFPAISTSMPSVPLARPTPTSRSRTSRSRDSDRPRRWSRRS